MSDVIDGKVIGLDGQPHVTGAAPNIDLLNIARQFLADVEAGKVSGALVLTQEPRADGVTDIASAWFSTTCVSLLGGLERAKWAMNNTLDRIQDQEGR